MNSKPLRDKVSLTVFTTMAQDLGLAINMDTATSSSQPRDQRSFIDIEMFFLSATYNLKTSRIAEGFLCWIVRFGRYLSPSKIRRLIHAGEPFDSAVLGGLLELLVENKIHALQWTILKPYTRPREVSEALLVGPTPRSPSPYFLKFGIIAPHFKLEKEKFLLPIKAIFQNSIELKNRALFGSVANADVASYLQRHPHSTPYQVAKATHHHKARIFEIFHDIAEAVGNNDSRLPDIEVIPV